MQKSVGHKVTTMYRNLHCEMCCVCLNLAQNPNQILGWLAADHTSWCQQQAHSLLRLFQIL